MVDGTAAELSAPEIVAAVTVHNSTKAAGAPLDFFGGSPSPPTFLGA
jgi:hypothetical protein